MEKQKMRRPGRLAVCILLVLLIFAGFELRLMQWQIVQGDEFEQQALSSLTDTLEIDAARGEIWDREGRVLAGNRTSYNVVYNALYMDYTRGRRNATILEVVDLLEEYGEEWVDRLPIALNEEGDYYFKEDNEAEIAQLKSKGMLNLADYATADDCMRELAKLYGCQGFSKRDTRTIASVRYGMTQTGYSRNNPYIIAQDVSAEMVGIISEVASQWPGIEVRVSVARYSGADGTLAPHVLGYSGTIQAAKWEQIQEEGQQYSSKNISGYKMSDTIGISGAEAAFEDQLRGTRGQQSIFTDENGSVVSTAMVVQPEEGHTVQLTLDSELQRVANLSLEKNIKNNTKAKNCTAGAAVAIDVKNFGVLASSSYPTYDLNLFLEDNKYNNEIRGDEEQKPMLDRALTGAYTPGSVFKPLVAITGLQEGVFHSGMALYDCTGKYVFADNTTLGCTGHHGNANVYGAIAGSCNAYFCQAGIDIGIDKLDAYAEYFGLGQLTGVELPERQGLMSNPQEYMVQHPGVSWTDGITAQTAIGQADNLFTPIQLATYCATIANGGVRKQAHFLDKVLSYTGEEVLEDYESPVVMDAGISSEVMGVVWESMRQVCVSGTARSVFGNYPISVAAKTGTAETSGEIGGTEANLSFICFAPMNDPEIAVAVMMEHGNDGTYAQNVAKDILDQYFGFYTWDEDGNRRNAEGKRVDDEGKVLDDDEPDEEDPQDPADPQDEKDGDGEAEGDEPESTPKPTRGSDIPDTPFAGDAPSSAPEEEDPDTTPTPKPNNTPNGGPYYKGAAPKTNRGQDDETSQSPSSSDPPPDGAD